MHKRFPDIPRNSIMAFKGGQASDGADEGRKGAM